MRVLTYNLDKDSVEPDAAIEVILKCDPDVICFQEASAEWQALLRRRLGRPYRHASFNQPAIGYDGMGVMSKFPIVEETWLPRTGGGWFPSQRLVLDTPLGPVQVLNVHLRPPSSDSGNKVMGYLTTGGIRRDEMKGLLGHLTAGGPAIVVGDFNEGDSGGAVECCTRKGYADALPEFDRKSSTWQGQYMGMKLTERPDHVMYSGELRCFEARVVPEKASDHDPVMAVMGLKSGR
jgi:endonuclease/exonuclease/phosphatase (EEP) superfamily protein YafD